MGRLVVERIYVDGVIYIYRCIEVEIYIFRFVDGLCSWWFPLLFGGNDIFFFRVGGSILVYSKRLNDMIRY